MFFRVRYLVVIGNSLILSRVCVFVFCALSYPYRAVFNSVYTAMLVFCALSCRYRAVFNFIYTTMLVFCALSYRYSAVFNFVGTAILVFCALSYRYQYRAVFNSVCTVLLCGAIRASSWCCRCCCWLNTNRELVTWLSNTTKGFDVLTHRVHETEVRKEMACCGRTSHQSPLQTRVCRTAEYLLLTIVRRDLTQRYERI